MPNMIPVATYSTLQEANAYADKLVRAGIPCEVRSATEEETGWENLLGEGSEGLYDLWVHEADQEEALWLLEHAEWNPVAEKPGQRDMLVGSVLGGVGLLTSLGGIPGVDAPWSWLPYLLAISGGVLFYRGTQAEKSSESEQ